MGRITEKFHDIMDWIIIILLVVMLTVVVFFCFFGPAIAAWWSLYWGSIPIGLVVLWVLSDVIDTVWG